VIVSSLKNQSIDKKNYATSVTNSGTAQWSIQPMKQLEASSKLPNRVVASFRKLPNLTAIDPRLLPLPACVACSSTSWTDLSSSSSCELPKREDAIDLLMYIYGSCTLFLIILGRRTTNGPNSWHLKAQKTVQCFGSRVSASSSRERLNKRPGKALIHSKTFRAYIFDNFFCKIRG
jgi:hypothetical protein